nr:hypothetical protein JVH1_4025 [Rhodococcus sp. JVH1]
MMSEYCHRTPGQHPLYGKIVWIRAPPSASWVPRVPDKC